MRRVQSLLAVCLGEDLFGGLSLDERGARSFQPSMKAPILVVRIPYRLESGWGDFFPLQVYQGQ